MQTRAFVKFCQMEIDAGIDNDQELKAMRGIIQHRPEVNLDGFVLGALTANAITRGLSEDETCQLIDIIKERLGIQD